MQIRNGKKAKTALPTRKSSTKTTTQASAAKTATRKSSTKTVKATSAKRAKTEKAVAATPEKIKRTEVVKIDGLYKKYSKKAAWAIENISFSAYEGEILGVIGHNGAGKSTTLKCLEGMLPFDKGTITICGHNIKKQPLLAKQNMGFVTDNHAVFLKMTGVQYLNFIADVYKVPSSVRQQRIEQLDKVFYLGNAINNLISSYSHGTRQKICMMGSLIHQPKLWILDEPMTGLDPFTMRAVQVYMREYVKDGKCIIFSSHSLNTVKNICDRVVLIKKGRQTQTLDVKKIINDNPNFDFEEYFFKQ